MGLEAMKPMGLALRDYFNGNKDSFLKLIRDDGRIFQEPASIFFRNELLPIEEKALELCRGKILVVGAGTGIHSLPLQNKKMDVTALDILPEACEIMRRKGQEKVVCADFFEFNPGGFDTVLMLGRNIGMTETLPGLEKFLKNLYNLLSVGCRLVLNSWDVSKSCSLDDSAYQEKNRKNGKYFGEVRNSIEYEKIKGAEFGWLYVDPEALKICAIAAGFRFTLILYEKDGNFLAVLEK